MRLITGVKTLACMALEGEVLYNILVAYLSNLKSVMVYSMIGSSIATLSFRN